MSLITFNFESQCLNGNTTIGIILPDRPRDQTAKDFYETGRKYKVLWLLHGTYGDYSDWLRKSSIELYACEKNLVVAMPSALNSNYNNWDGCMMGYNVFDYFFEELMLIIYNWFPVSDKREDNFIAGLSMGGDGALKFALAHPEKFSAVASLSWAPINLRKPVKGDILTSGKRFSNSVNNAGNMAAYLNSNDNIWDRLPEYASKKGLPDFYFTCGTTDFLFGKYRAFKKYAQKCRFNAVFEEVDGYGHEWRFWDLAIQQALVFFKLD